MSYQEGEHRGGYVRFIDDQCLQTVNTPLLRGRYFNHSDRIGSEPVVIISQSLAKNAWKGEDPLGKIALVNNGAEYKVIGIVADVAHGLDGNTPPDFYLSFEQWERSHWSSPNLVFRTTASSRSPLGQVRAAIQEYDATLPTNEFTHLTDMVTVHGLRTYVFRPNSCISVSVYVKKRISRKSDLKSSQLGPQYTLLGDSVRVQGVSGYQVNLE